MRDLRRVAVIGGDHAGSVGSILRGFYHYARPDKPWIVRDYSRHQDDLSQIERAIEFEAEVIVANVYLPEVATRLQKLKLPVLTWSYIHQDLPFPRIGVDDEEVGRIGAELFLARGYQHFGFSMHSGWAFSQSRLAGYQARLADAGFGVNIMPETHIWQSVASSRMEDKRITWLLSQPKPLAVMADLDSQGRIVCEAAGAAGLRVPEDVAVLGASNFEMLCELCWPPLSSVQTPDEKIGYELGRLTEQVLEGKSVPPVTVFPPTGIVERRSTDVFATDDPNLSAALRVMRDRVADGVNVAEVLRTVPISRGHLFRLFKARLGRSPLEEIQRLRCEAAKQLLINTDLPIPVVATKSGFCSSSHLGRVFKELMGMAPAKFRRAK